MKNSKILIYDGSFNGFLTAIFVAFEEKIEVSDIQKNSVGPKWFVFRYPDHLYPNG